MKQQQNPSKIEQRLEPIITQNWELQNILAKTLFKEQISLLGNQLDKIDQNSNLTKDQKQYQKHLYQQQLFRKLQLVVEPKSIPHINQNIEASNPELMLYVLKEQLLRDLNIEVLKSNKIKSFGLDQVIRIFSQDQSCFKIRNEQLDYDKIMEDKKLLEFHLVDFTQKLSSSLQIPIDQIEILGVSKGSFEINFLIKGKTYDEIQQLIQNIPAAQVYLHKYCNGKIEYLAYFDQARVAEEQLAKSSGIILTSDEFNPKYNMKWSNFKEKEQRGPPDHRYDYYFPRGCYGFGLDIKKHGENQDWIQMDGNPNEWRIMYHGTRQKFVNSIVKNNLMVGVNNLYANNDCQDEFGNMIKVGNGIYFSNDFNVCTRDRYASYTQVLDKQFAVIFMIRVNPKKIRQSQKMKLKNYFVVNESKDVRPYRILLHEKKRDLQFSFFFIFQMKYYSQKLKYNQLRFLSQVKYQKKCKTLYLYLVEVNKLILTCQDLILCCNFRYLYKQFYPRSQFYCIFYLS